MASNVPAKLRSADITRFAQRAAQVEKVKPPVAYWCYYWMVQSVLSKGLHNQDDECRQYTTDLMDKLEELKSNNSSNDAITDDMAGQAYIEQFGQETFQRADNTMSANKVTRQTADTFQASATFLDLVHIWGTPSEEITSKIKYAKFHALRIAKALKAGEDPNATNPAPTPTPDPEDVVVLDPNDPEVQDLNKTAQYATVEDAPDDTETLRSEAAAQSTLDQSLHPSRDASTARAPSMWPPRRDDYGDGDYRNNEPTESKGDSPAGLAPNGTFAPPPISPLAPTAGSLGLPPPSGISPQDHNEVLQDDANGNPRHNSIGGGYFPEVQLPEVPSDQAESLPPPSGPLSPTGFITPSTAQPPANAHDFYRNTTQPPTAPAAPLSPPMPRSDPPPPAFSPAPAAPRVPQQPRSFATQQVTTPQRQPASSAASQAQATAGHVADEMAMVDAQKHAKWAISALNFEDVPTAVKELREALRSLGAS